MDFCSHGLCPKVARFKVSFVVEEFVGDRPRVDLATGGLIGAAGAAKRLLTDFWRSPNHCEALSFSVVFGLLYSAETAAWTRFKLGLESISVENYGGVYITY